MAFPIILIIAGLALATISVIKQGKPLTMDPSIYEEKTNWIYANANSDKCLDETTACKSTDIQDFYNSYLYPETSEFNYQRPANTDKFRQIASPDGKLDDLQAFGTYINDTHGTDLSWGSVYVNYIGADSDFQSLKRYEAVVLVNATSNSGPGAFGSVVNSAFL